jgi:glutamate carboxypeptidase
MQRFDFQHPSFQERCERLLEELVNVDSPTLKFSGVRKVQEIVARELMSLGFKTKLIPNPSPTVESAELLLGELQGESSEFVIFVSHADTVQTVSNCGLFRRDEAHGFGSGVIDNKGGLVVLLEGLRLYLESHRRPAFSLRVVSSPNEEAGSLGFHELFLRYSCDSKMVLGFEPALDNGAIIESRRGNRWYQIEINGEEAHAGRCRGEQINAAHELAIKIAKLHELNDEAQGLSLNIGQIQAGRDRFNVVCGQASAKLDTRFASFESRDRLHTEIERILFTSHIRSPITGRTAQTTYSVVDDCPPFSNNIASAAVIEFVLNSIHSLEQRPVVSETSGGAGDVNYMSRAEIVVIDGLGPLGGKMHQPSEFVVLSTLNSRARVLACLLNETPQLLAATKV